MTTIEQAAIAYCRARRAKIDAKRALRDLQADWEFRCERQHFQEQAPCYATDKLFGEWCSTCQARQPYWEGYQKARHAQNAALQHLVHLCAKVGAS